MTSLESQFNQSNMFQQQQQQQQQPTHSNSNFESLKSDSIFVLIFLIFQI